jgi:hypothetical protein
MSDRRSRREGIRDFNTMLKTLYNKGYYYDTKRRIMFYAAGYLIHLWNTENTKKLISKNTKVLFSTEDEKNLVQGIYEDLLNKDNLISIV